MKKKLLTALAAVAMLICFPLTAYAGEWQQDYKGYWYINDDGTKPIAKWEQIDGKWYYFRTDGYRNTGWVKVDGKWYYCEPTGEMRTTTLQTDVFTFRFNADGTCTNFYDNTTPSTEAGWYHYDSSSASTWANVISKGWVISYNGSYWATPDYVNMLRNPVVYTSDTSFDDTSSDDTPDPPQLFGKVTTHYIEYEGDEHMDLDGVS